MSFLIVPLFCASVGFVFFLAASWFLSYLHVRSSRRKYSSRRERKAAGVMGVAVGLGFAIVFAFGSNGGSGLMVSAILDGVILLAAVGLVWRILTTRTVRR
jgi:hypothetical protein